MQGDTGKGRSPFYPGQPVPVEFFAGRRDQIERIVRAAGQVRNGKPQALFLVGEYGIGKSSLAAYARRLLEKDCALLGIHVFLGGAKDVADVATKTVEATIKARVYQPTVSEKIRNFLAKYVGQPEVFGVSIDFERLRADGPGLSRGFLPFLRELLARVREDGPAGILLILDEINGISANPEFAHFIKTVVDENATGDEPVPLLLMLCGTEERRRDLIGHHPPVERIFDVVDIAPMTEPEMVGFYTKAFESVGMAVLPDAMKRLCHYAAGFPRVMHTIGDEVFWADRDSVVDLPDATAGVIGAAREIGRKFVDAQVYQALMSKDYRSILEKLGRAQFDIAFKKADIEQGLTPTEQGKFDNFLQRMKRLQVLRSGDAKGEYVFCSRIVRLYIVLNSLPPSSPEDEPPVVSDRAS
ncbi:MAG: ATP-binding protein [candidate division WOR-3 bacterium]|nr:ATP-binding protein [candidate division WOR-3 bacterium]